jgi:hypothetical protein
MEDWGDCDENFAKQASYGMQWSSNVYALYVRLVLLVCHVRVTNKQEASV